MKDLYAALTGSAGRFIQSWLFPSALYVAVFTITLFPLVRNTWPFSATENLSAAEQGLVAAGAALLVAFVLAALTRPLYRVLEGYHLPRRTERQRIARSTQKELAASADASHTEKQQARERLDLYPHATRLVMPTRLGNALKAGESYGKTQYGLDTVILWPHLTTVAPDKLLDQVDEARAILDAMAGSLWLSVVFSVSSWIVAASNCSGSAAVYGMVAAGSVPLLYFLAVQAAGWYAKTLRALADLSRLELAKAFNLALPAKLDDERELWTAVTNLVAWGPYWANSREWSTTIQRFRGPGKRPLSETDADRAAAINDRR